MPDPSILADLPKYTREAVRFYWQTRSRQSEKQRAAGGSDQGSRSAVTGGAQMNGFIELLTKLVVEAGIDRSHIHYKDSLELPGYFRQPSGGTFSSFQMASLSPPSRRN